MEWRTYSATGRSPSHDFSFLLDTGADTSNTDPPNAPGTLPPLTNPAEGSSDTQSYDPFPAANHLNLMPVMGVAGTGLQFDARASTSYHHRTADQPYPSMVSSHAFDKRFGAPYEPRSILPTSVAHPLNVHSNGSGFIDSSTYAPQPPTRSGNTATWLSTMAPYSAPYPVQTDPSSIGPQVTHWPRASVASGSRATAYPASSPVLSTVPYYKGLKFQLMARGPSTEPTEIKEWKPEHSWDYTIHIEDTRVANNLIYLNDPTNIPVGSLGLWFYMKKAGSDDRIEGPTCAACAKRQLTNVVRFREAITTVQTRTRIICSQHTTGLEPLPDNTAYVADVSFLIWCPAYHEARSDHSPTRVKQPRKHFQLVCELRDHQGGVLATTTLHRTWGGTKRSRQFKKDADRRSGHRASISGEFTTPQVDNYLLPSSHAHLSSPCIDKRAPLPHIPPIKVEASSPTYITSPRVDLPSSPRVELRSRGRVKAGPASALPAVPPVILSPEDAVIEIVNTPAPSDDVVEMPAPPIYVGSSSPQSRRAPAPSPESPGRTAPPCVLGPRIIAPPLSESVIGIFPRRPDFLGVWREEGKAGDEVQLTGAGFNRETEYFVQFGEVRQIQAYYQASNILSCKVPWSDTMGIVPVSIVSRDGSMLLCDQQRQFRYLSYKRFTASQRITAALDSADEEDIEGEVAEFARRLSSKKKERQSLKEGHEINPGRQPQLSGATAVVNSPVPFDHDPLLSSQPSLVNDDQTLSRSRSSTLVSPSAHSYSFHEIKSLGVDPSSWDRVRSWFERKDSTMTKGRKRSAEEMEDDQTLETSRVSESPTLAESLATKVAGSPRVRHQETHKTSCEAQPRSKKQRLNGCIMSSQR